MRIYAYLRASTKEQDASRAKDALRVFVENHNLEISNYFFENESGASLQRPKLFSLLDIAEKGDILLVEQVDRISRLNCEDWNKLKSLITNKGIMIVSLDLPTSYQFLTKSNNENTLWMMSSINTMMLDMLASFARKDYEDRRRRQAEGIAKAKDLGKYKGRPKNEGKRRQIKALLNDGYSIQEVVKELKCSNKTVIAIRKELALNHQ